MKSRPNGATDVTEYFVMRDSTTHAPKTDVTITDIDIYYQEQGAAQSAKADLTALAAANSAHADNKGYHCGNAVYRIDWPDAAFDGGAGKSVILIVVCAGCDTIYREIQLSPPVDIIAISGDTTAADNCELMFDGTGYAGGTTKLGVDTVAISGDSTAADNLESACDGTGYNLGGGDIVAASVTAGVTASTVSDKTGYALTSAYDAAKNAAPETGGNIAAIKSKTDNLPASPAAVGSAMTLDAAETGTGLTAVPWNASWDAEVQSECADALTAYDPPTKTEMTSAFTEIKGATWSSATDTLEALRDQGDSAWTTATGFSTHSAADVVTELGTGSTLTACATATGFSTHSASDVVTALGTGSTLTACATATGFATASDITTAHSTTDGKIDAVDNYVDTEVTAIKAVTDKLDTALELDGAVYRYTTNALEQAPSGGLDAAGVRTALGMAAANLDDQLDALPTAAENADATWDEALSEHTNVGSAGAGLSAAGSAGDPWATTLPGSYGAGTAGKIIGDNINAPIATVDTVVDAIKSKTDHLPDADAGASGGVFIAGTNAATTIKSSGTALTLWSNGGSGNGLVIRGHALGNGVVIRGGAYGAGVEITGGETSGEGVNISTTDGDGLVIAANGSGKQDINADTVTAIKAVTDKVDTALELDGAVYRYTTNALEQAPSGGLDAAGVRTALGMAAANLDDQLDALPTAAENADATWDEALSEHTNVGSAGAGLSAAGSAGDPWSTALPGAYGAGTAGQIVGDNVDGLAALIGSGSITVVSPVSEDGGTITIVQGDDYNNSDGRALEWFSDDWPDITGASITLHIEDSGGTYSEAGSVVTGGSGTQTVRVELPSADTATLDAGFQKFHLEAVLTSGRVVTLATGVAHVIADIK